MRLPSARQLLLVAYAAVLTLTWQVWLGYPNVYTVAKEKAATLHNAILHNAAPAGETWGTLGANGTNVRRLAVELGELAHRASGLPLHWTYFLLDTVFLFASILLLARYVSRWLAPSGVAIALLYYGAVGSLAYQFGYFHPWDRPSQVAWLLALLCLGKDRFWPFLATLLVGMTIKFDMLPLPGLYAAVTWSKRPRGRWLMESGALFALAVGCMWVLKSAYPGGFTSTEELGLVGRAGLLLQGVAHDLKTQGPAFPPLLMFGLPFGLALVGWRQLVPELRWSVLFGASLFVPFALSSNLREVRAQVPVLFLILPAAVQTVQRWLGDADRSAQGDADRSAQGPSGS